MNMKQIIRGFISSNIKKKSESYSDADSLFKKNIMTSLDVVQLIMFLEDNYRFIIKPKDITVGNFESIDQIDYFLSKSQMGYLPEYELNPAE